MGGCVGCRTKRIETGWLVKQDAVDVYVQEARDEKEKKKKQDTHEGAKRDTGSPGGGKGINGRT